MAEVWRAYDSRLQVWRAVKLLLPDYVKRSKIRKRFESEAQAMALLEHPNIVRVYDVGSDAEQSWIVMELCDGGSIEAWIDKNGPLPPRLAVDVALQIAAGIHAAHEHGVVHRDIKPQNVLITAQGTCKVTDFGIAHIEDMSLTRTGTVMGTLGYMAPEQRSDSKKVDRRTDVYAVGATLYTLLTGKIEMDLFAAGQDPTKLEGIPQPLATVITHATAYHREERPASMRELGKALGEARSKLPPVPKGTAPLAPQRIERPPAPSVVEQALAQAASGDAAVPPLPGETLAPAYDLFDGVSIPPSLRRAAAEKAATAKPATLPAQPAAGGAPPTSLVEEVPPADPTGRKRGPSPLPWVPSAQRRREEKPIDFDSLYVQEAEAGKPVPVDVDTSPTPALKTPLPKAPGAPKTPPTTPAPAADKVTSYKEEDAEKDPGKEAGRGIDTTWALREGWKFLMQIAGGLLQYASSPLQYMLWPLVAVLAIALIASFQGASHVVTAQTATTTSYNTLTTTLDRSAPELVDELAFAGGNRQVLEAHYTRYKEAKTPEEERAAALALTKVMEETIVRLDETTDPREIARRKSMQGRIQALTRQRTEFIDSESAWQSSAETTTGMLAVKLGLAGKPPPGTD